MTPSMFSVKASRGCVDTVSTEVVALVVPAARVVDVAIVVPVTLVSSEDTPNASRRRERSRDMISLSIAVWIALNAPRP